MNPVDAAWHLLDFFAPALTVALLSASFAKLCWRRELKTVRWSRLVFFGAVACMAVTTGGLAVFGHDGRMATYAAMVGAGALAVWWAGFRPRGR